MSDQKENSLVQDNLYKKVELALDSIRPYLETDGGNVKLLEITNQLEVKLELLGACGNCPMSTMTLKAGVEEAIKRAVPEVKSVDAVNITSPDDPNARLPENLR
ncbi:MAG: NifU family protein [Candidatus Cyclobacteriaceae bacterium M3_2C_046]